MQKLIHILYDRIVDILVRVIGIVMISCILLQIFSRTFLQVPFKWTDELARFTFLWFCFLGSVMTLRHKMHLGIDYFESKMSPKIMFLNRIFVQLLVIAFGVIVAYQGFRILDIVAIQSSPILRLNMRYIYGALPVTGVLYTVLGVAQLVEHVQQKGKREVAG